MWALCGHSPELNTLNWLVVYGQSEDIFCILWSSDSETWTDNLHDSSQLLTEWNNSWSDPAATSVCGAGCAHKNRTTYLNILRFWWCSLDEDMCTVYHEDRSTLRAFLYSTLRDCVGCRIQMQPRCKRRSSRQYHIWQFLPLKLLLTSYVSKYYFL